MDAYHYSNLHTEPIHTGNLRFNDQSLGEEIANSVSHGVAAILSIIGTVFAIVSAVNHSKGAMTIVSAAIFGFGFLAVYLTSCLYHTISNLKVKRVLQILDHCMIYVMIAASYAPVCLNMIRGPWGYSILSVNVACMILGITVNLIDMHKFYRLSQALYLIMGWLIIVAAVPAIRAIPLSGLGLLALGGILYTVSVIFYKMKDKKYMHFLFHLLVVAGSVPHFLFVLLYCCR